VDKLHHLWQELLACDGGLSHQHLRSIFREVESIRAEVARMLLDDNPSHEDLLTLMGGVTSNDVL
jgi:hypothetical protein